MERCYIPMAVIKRLPRYYKYLGDLSLNKVSRISSKELSESIGFTASQIRQDLSYFGAFGQQGYGYNVDYLYTELKKILGLENNYKLVILGAGNIGKALSGYTNFSRIGFDTIALFDVNKKLIGMNIRGVPIRDIAEIESFLAENKADIGVIATSPKEAFSAAETLIRCGVKGIWNFTGVDLRMQYGGDIIVEDVHLTDSLLALAFMLNLKNRKENLQNKL